MITIKGKKKEHRLSLSEFSRWACLVEAYHFIDQKAQELGIDPTELIKPLAIEKYINERYHAMMYDVTFEYDLGNLC